MKEKDKKTETEAENSVKSEIDSRANVLVLNELTSFVKESTGLSIALAYLVLILSSMAYLGIYFSAFDIEIIRFITLEDILATPIKNPDIIIVFIVIFGFLYLSDVSNQLDARPRTKPVEKLSLFRKALRIVTWAPKARRNSIKLTAIITFLVLSLYIIVFAYTASSSIKDGEGSKVEITLADDAMPLRLTLLGTTTHFIFAYDIANDQSLVFQVESIESIRVIRTEQSPVNLDAPKSYENTEPSEPVQKLKEDNKETPESALDNVPGS